MTEYRVVLVTAPNAETGAKIGRSCVEAGLAACVNIIPTIRSIYMWKGAVNDDGESLLIIKTRRPLVEQLTALVREHHPYEVCEVISMPIDGGSVPYLDWISEVTKK